MYTRILYTVLESSMRVVWGMQYTLKARRKVGVRYVGYVGHKSRVGYSNAMMMLVGC